MLASLPMLAGTTAAAPRRSTAATGLGRNESINSLSRVEAGGAGDGPWEAAAAVTRGRRGEGDSGPRLSREWGLSSSSLRRWWDRTTSTRTSRASFSRMRATASRPTSGYGGIEEGVDDFEVSSPAEVAGHHIHGPQHADGTRVSGDVAEIEAQDFGMPDDDGGGLPRGQSFLTVVFGGGGDGRKSDVEYCAEGGAGSPHNARGTTARCSFSVGATAQSAASELAGDPLRCTADGEGPQLPPGHKISEAGSQAALLEGQSSSSAAAREDAFGESARGLARTAEEESHAQQQGWPVLGRGVATVKSVLKQGTHGRNKTHGGHVDSPRHGGWPQQDARGSRGLAAARGWRRVVCGWGRRH